MQLDIRGINLELTQTLRDFVSERVQAAASRFEKQIERLTVRLEDVNGPRGGSDKHVKIHAHLLPSEDQIIESSDPDLYTAVDNAVSRLKQVLGKRANRLPKSHARPARSKPRAAGDLSP